MLVPMHESYASLVQALRERLEVIADREAARSDPAAHLERLKSVSEKIVMLQGQLPSPIDSQLQHFLQRCSYDKALGFIENLQPARRSGDR